MVLSNLRIAFMGIAVTSGVVMITTGVASAQEADGVQDDDIDHEAAAALALPGPNQFVSALDLECFDTPGPALNIAIGLRHLNPVLIGLGFPAHQVIIRELQQTCVPVLKNGVVPPPAVLPFVQHVDLACYRVDSPPVTPKTLALKHLNPVLAGFPVHGMTIVQPAQLCVPVAKNGVLPPPEVLRLVQYIDLECYRGDPGVHPIFGVNLRQLNPQLGGILPHNMTLIPQQRQLCVPVQKNVQPIPNDVLNIVRWVDLEKFVASPPVIIAPVPVTLSHLNPLFTTLPRVPVILERGTALMVPVSKNGATPPLP
jgi:hypothetical protein